jgi:two-component system, chemotaxis family, CheB/CheR fusion protein
MPKKGVPLPAAPQPAPDFAIVGVGASAGGFGAFAQLLEGLPPVPNLAIIFVQHLAPHHSSSLAALLAGHTPLPVIEATEGARIVPNPVVRRAHPYYLVLFQTPKPSDDTKASKPARREKKLPPGSRITKLEEELAATREYLQSTIQEIEAANEELQSANEEILSSNEELQSTNEELDTAKEELQSTNEELNTVNDELHARNEELTRVNADLLNLLASVQIAIVIVARDLRVRRFTPMAEKKFNLIASDIGRPFSQISTTLQCPELPALINETIDSVAPVERTVQDATGETYLLRIRPYKTPDNRIDGAVIALFDLDPAKK